MNSVTNPVSIPLIKMIHLHYITYNTSSPSPIHWKFVHTNQQHKKHPDSAVLLNFRHYQMKKKTPQQIRLKPQMTHRCESDQRAEPFPDDSSHHITTCPTSRSPGVSCCRIGQSDLMKCPFFIKHLRRIIESNEWSDHSNKTKQKIKRKQLQILEIIQNDVMNKGISGIIGWCSLWTAGHQPGSGRAQGTTLFTKTSCSKSFYIKMTGREWGRGGCWREGGGAQGGGPRRHVAVEKRIISARHVRIPRAQVLDAQLAHTAASVTSGARTGRWFSHWRHI